MFSRQTRQKKDGKTHSYWSVVENQRLDGGRVVQRPVLYLGEINSSQAAVWRKAIEVLDEDAGHPQTLALFPEDRCDAVTPGATYQAARSRHPGSSLCSALQAVSETTQAMGAHPAQRAHAGQPENDPGAGSGRPSGGSAASSRALEFRRHTRSIGRIVGNPKQHQRQGMHGVVAPSIAANFAG